MFKHYFEQMDGVEIYPIISLLIFVLFFIAVLIRVIKADRVYIKEMEGLPLDNEK